jgi:hypothetical protein
MHNSVSLPCFEVYLRLHWWSTISPLVSHDDTWCSSALISSLEWVCSTMLWGLYIPILHNDLQVDKIVYKWHLALICLRKSSSCILKYKKSWHLPSLRSIKFSPWILKSKTMISRIPMCCSKCHNVNTWKKTFLQMVLCWWLAYLTLWEL